MFLVAFKKAGWFLRCGMRIPNGWTSPCCHGAHSGQGEPGGGGVQTVFVWKTDGGYPPAGDAALFGDNQPYQSQQPSQTIGIVGYQLEEQGEHQALPMEEQEPEMAGRR